MPTHLFLMLSCLYLLHMCGLGLYQSPFSELVRDLLPRKSKRALPEYVFTVARIVSRFIRVTGTAWGKLR